MLNKLTLQNFRNYSQREFCFFLQATLIVGPNAIGKTNILEAIYLLATGQSFRAEVEKEVIREGSEVSRIIGDLDNKDQLEISWDSRERFQKLYKVNGVGKRQVDFVGHIFAVLFSPMDLEIVVNGPSIRRKYLDFVLSQVHKDYRVAAHIYERALRQRNRILKQAREEGLRASDIVERLDYWNKLLIENGEIIHRERKSYLEFLSGDQIQLHYDHSTITVERLAKYAVEEVGAAATLVGPHRDDFAIFEGKRNVRLYGSRGEQRLAVFTLKLGELEYIRKQTGTDPILLLDDIFSELDIENRHHVLDVIPKQQTIMTTTDLELIDKNYLKKAEVIELG